MGSRLPVARRLTTAATWPVGALLTGWAYMWRTTPAHRREVLGAQPEDDPPALPPGVSRDGVQPAGEGAGPLFHRRYAVRVRDPRLGAEALMALLQADPDQAAPTEFARFIKTCGAPGRMRVGDEYVVRMPGPWDGPVRVVEADARCFRLATLDGHLEAGQIAFRARPWGGGLEFEIESWASSGGPASALLYAHARISKEVQVHMWTSALERVVGISGGRRAGPIDISTRRVDRGLGGGAIITPARARRRLDRLADAPLNFSPGEPAGACADGARGWRHDDVRRPLATEPPGPPVPGGAFEAARRLVRDYEFPDPAIVRAAYRPDVPLERRDLLLELRWLGMRLHGGVRVDGIVDEDREVAGRPARVWGWSYSTLQGHPEAGRRDYEVWKWLDTGEVEFRTHACSRVASHNPVVRAAFRVLGRRRQRRFVRSACDRMALLTRVELRHGGPADGPPPTGEGLVSRPLRPTGEARAQAS